MMRTKRVHVNGRDYVIETFINLALAAKVMEKKL